MRQGVAILFVLVALVSCHHNGKQVPEVNGDVSAADIASDTLNQLAMESSYEYHKTVPVSGNLSYDIFAYGAPAQGEYIILRHTAERTDTLVKASRRGTFEAVWLTHLNKNSSGEIIIVTRLTDDSTYYRSLLAYSIDKNNALAPIKYTPNQGEMMNGNDKGRDSFYIQNNQVIRQYPLYASDDAICCPTGGRIRVHYELKDEALVVAGKMDMDIQ